MHAISLPGVALWRDVADSRLNDPKPEARKANKSSSEAAITPVCLHFLLRPLSIPE